MTREQAINYLFSSGFTNEQVGEVVRALTYEPTTKNDLGVDCISRADAIRVASGYCHPSNVAKELAKLRSVTPQLSSELDKNSKKLEKDFGESDCISRERLKQIVFNITAEFDTETIHIDRLIGEIDNLPSVTPQESRKGKWLSRWHAGHDLHFHVCSECNEEFSCDMETGISIDNYRYCPNCGAKMEVEE